VQYDKKGENVCKVSKAILHPKYKHPYWPPVQYDIAILKLASPIQTTKFFACLPRNNQDQYVGQNVTAMGWGLTSIETGKTSEFLMAASFTVLDNNRCREAFEKRFNDNIARENPKPPYYYFPMYPFIICAEHPKVAACFADSGGWFLNASNLCSSYSCIYCQITTQSFIITDTLHNILN
jgi:hypothetical protein